MSDRPPKYDEFTRQIVEQYNEIAQLAGALAHEIKNPLSVINMNIELLSEDFRESSAPECRRALDRLNLVQRQCRRLQTLLDDFLRFARVRQLDLRPGNLNEQIRRVLDLFSPHAQQAKVHIVEFLDPDLPSVMIDEHTLEAALVNLVKNALEAMPDGGRLEVRTRVTRKGVALDLIDTGIGMDESTAIHMFDTFFSTKDGGSGLGLPTTRRIIEAHGARIDVQSEVGRGTQFTIEFPTPARLSASPDIASPDVASPDVDRTSPDTD